MSKIAVETCVAVFYLKYAISYHMKEYILCIVFITLNNNRVRVRLNILTKQEVHLLL
jgi:hypothetical protein